MEWNTADRNKSRRRIFIYRDVEEGRPGRGKEGEEDK